MPETRGPKAPIAPITVTANAEPSAAAVIHKLYAPTREPITGLVDNGVYYVVGATATSFQLAATVGGTALTLTVPAGAASGSGVLSSVPVDLTASGNVTTGRLLFDIAGTGTVNLVLRHTTAASTISSTGRQALAEMRRLLGVLRTGEHQEGGEYVPQPDVAQIKDLVEQCRGSGLSVDFRIEGTPRPLPSGVELTAYRIVQEALTNAAGNFYINDKSTGAVVGQQPFGGGRASGTNDKAGAPQNLLRWTLTRAIKEALVPPTDYTYPHMG